MTRNMPREKEIVIAKSFIHFPFIFRCQTVKLSHVSKQVKFVSSIFVFGIHPTPDDVLHAGYWGGEDG